jgi:type IV pilus assembly protein PilM
MFLRRNKSTKHDMVVGLDLGARQLKAAVLQRENGELKLARYLVTRSVAATGKTGSPDRLGAELQELMGQLGVSDRSARVAISCPSATVCETEMPRTPLDDAKSALRLNSARYVRRDLSGFYLDAVELSESSAKDAKGKKPQTMRILIAAADREEVRWYRAALEIAKIRPEAIELSALTVVNAFQMGSPELCEKEIVVLLDIGAHSTSINLLRQGQPAMTRIMHFGGNHISEYVGSILTLQPNVAEEEKIKMSESVQAIVGQAISPLAREIRSSIDFFERQQECHVSRALACGGSACSPNILQLLSDEVGFHIESWNPVQTLSTAHFNGEGPKLESLAPSLAAAIGAAAPHV